MPRILVVEDSKFFTAVLKDRVPGLAGIRYRLRAQDQELRGSKVLSKPFHLRELVDQVNDVLNQKASVL